MPIDFSFSQEVEDARLMMRGFLQDTVKSAFAALQAAPDQFVDAYGIERRNYYYRIADKRPQSRKFARSANGGKGGWIRRAEEFISERYHLSEAEHRQRVSSWG